MPVNRARGALASIGEEIYRLQQALLEEQQELNQAQQSSQGGDFGHNHHGAWTHDDPAAGHDHACNVLRLNIGGEICTYPRTVAKAFPHSKLAKVFDARAASMLPHDQEGRIFLDLDPSQMRLILDWLADVVKLGLEEATHPALDLEGTKAWGFKALCEFWGLPLPGQQAPTAPLSNKWDEGAKYNGNASWRNQSPKMQRNKAMWRGGVEVRLTSDSYLLSGDCLEALSTMFSSEVDVDLLYRASTDGWSTNKFARYCHHKRGLLVVASTPAGHIFGGFNDDAWASGPNYALSDTSFLFRLAAGETHTRPSQHMRTRRETVECYNGNGLPTFAEDLFFTQPDYAPHGEVTMQAVFRRFGSAYSRCCKKTSASFSALAEAGQVVITEMEVFQVKPKNAALEQFIDGCNSLLEHSYDVDETSRDLVRKTLNGLEAVKAAKAHLEANRVGKRLRADEVTRESAVLEKLRAGPASNEDQISLNVRGTMFRTFRSTLTSCHHSSFSDRFRDQWSTLSEEIVDDGVWINETPEYMAMLLQFLRMRHLAGAEALGTLQLQDRPYLHMKRMLRRLGIHDLNSHIHKPVLMRDISVLMTREMIEELSGMFPEWVSSMKLLYRATRDGWSQSVFDHYVHNQGATVVIARSRGGHIFGGFGNKPWGMDMDHNGYTWSDEAFLFRLAGPGNTIPSKHPVCNHHCAQLHNTSAFLTFGNEDFEITLDGQAQSPRLIPSKKTRRTALARFHLGRAYSKHSSIRCNEVYECLAEGRETELIELEVFRALPP